MIHVRGYVIVSLLVMALSYGLHIALRSDPSVRNVELFTEMVYSKAYESFTSSPNLPGGVTQQPLVDGVVPRGFEPFTYAPGAEEAQRAGRELENPLAALEADAAATRLNAGRELFRIYCGVCHDARGEGRGTVVEHGMPPPPSLHGARATQMADGEMLHIVTLGQGNMGSFASQLTLAERWSVILHVRKLQQDAR